MAGFINRNDNLFSKGIKSLTGPLKKLIQVGQEYDDLIIRNKIGMGPYETAARKTAGNNDEEIYIASTYDINLTQNKVIGFYQKDYQSQRAFMRKMSMHRDISKFLDIIADEAIIYDNHNYFCKPNHTVLDDLDENIKDEILGSLEDEFEYIYNVVYDFKEGKGAWFLFRQFLIDGILAFELVYDERGKKILKAILLDSSQLIPGFNEVFGEKIHGWWLNPTDEGNKRFLPETHIVYISYAKGFVDSSEMSYVQQLIRSFNLYRTMENTAVIWTIMNSSFRLKTIVPVAGGRGKNEQAVGNIVARFREEVQIDETSGEVRVDGQPQLNLFKNYALASKNGQQTTIESMKFEGYDLSSPELLKYWRDKLHEDSQIPYTRLQKDASSTFSIFGDSSQIDRDELMFDKFIRRNLSNFQEILLKPLYQQMILNYPDLEDDYFKSKLALRFNQENKFDLVLKRSLITQDLEFIDKLRAFQDFEGQPYWDLDLLIEEFAENIDYDLIKENKKRKEERKKSGESAEGDGEIDLDNLGDDTGDTLDIGGDDGGLDLGGGDDLGGLDLGTDEPVTPEAGSDLGDLDLDI